MSELTTIERAFQLAAAGPCRTIEDIRRRLTREGYEGVLPHLSGAGTRARLKAILGARTAPATAAVPASPPCG